MKSTKYSGGQAASEEKETESLREGEVEDQLCYKQQRIQRGMERI